MTDAQTKKILLVNPQVAFLERNKTLLNRAGFLILTATSASEALLLHRQHAVDVIVSLLEMSEMGGDELCASIRQDSELKTVPFIMVCYDNRDELERAARCGANAWVTKPVRPELLLEQVGRFVRIPTRLDYRANFSAMVNGTRENLVFSGMTRNISVSGLLCETSARLTCGDLLTNLLLTLGSRQLDADGRVVRLEEFPDGQYGYGIQFTRIDDEAREAIRQFVSSPNRQQIEDLSLHARPAGSSPGPGIPLPV